MIKWGLLWSLKLFFTHGRTYVRTTMPADGWKIVNLRELGDMVPFEAANQMRQNSEALILDSEYDETYPKSLSLGMMVRRWMG